MSNRVFAAALILACAPAFAAQPPAETPAPPQPPSGQPAMTMPTAPPAPAAVPVPDLPIVKKAELEGGLIIEDMKIGEGAEVKEHGCVVAHYHGTLKADGKEFDSSFKRGEPAAFPLDGVIPGWQKGVPGMKVGGIRKLTIPYAMAYGEAGRPPTIPEKSDLVFVIELKDALNVEEMKAGQGEEIGPRAIVIAATKISAADGKEIENYPAAMPYIWLPGELQGVDLGIKGMKVGGKCKVSIPAGFNPDVPGLQTKRPFNQPLVVELEILNVRNLVPPGTK